MHFVLKTVHGFDVHRSRRQIYLEGSVDIGVATAVGEQQIAAGGPAWHGPRPS